MKRMYCFHGTWIIFSWKNIWNGFLLTKYVFLKNCGEELTILKNIFHYFKALKLVGLLCITLLICQEKNFLTSSEVIENYLHCLWHHQLWLRNSVAKQMCCQLIKYSRFEGSIPLCSCHTFCKWCRERADAQPPISRHFQAIKYATLPRPLLYECSNVICGVHFFIGSSDGEILLLCVAEEWLQFRRDKIAFLYIARIILGVAEGNFHI